MEISGDNVKNLGVIINEKPEYGDNIDKITLSGRIMSGVMITLSTRDRKIDKMFNVYIKSNLNTTVLYDQHQIKEKPTS